MREVEVFRGGPRVSWERRSESPRESAGEEAIRRGSDRRHKGVRDTGCHFVRLGCRMVGEKVQGGSMA